MSSPHYLTHDVLPAAYALLPPLMRSPESVAMLVAIGLQESKLTARRQYKNGPARGLWQFEMGGIHGVLHHGASHLSALRVLEVLGLGGSTPRRILVLFEEHDVLAAAFARLLLWTDPRALPRPDQESRGWEIYRATWNPGKPHAETWGANFSAGWAAVKATA